MSRSGPDPRTRGADRTREGHGEGRYILELLQFLSSLEPSRHHSSVTIFFTGLGPPSALLTSRNLQPSGRFPASSKVRINDCPDHFPCILFFPQNSKLTSTLDQQPISNPLPFNFKLASRLHLIEPTKFSYSGKQINFFSPPVDSFHFHFPGTRPLRAVIGVRVFFATPRTTDREATRSTERHNAHIMLTTLAEIREIAIIMTSASSAASSSTDTPATGDPVAGIFSNREQLMILHSLLTMDHMPAVSTRRFLYLKPLVPCPKLHQRALGALPVK
ncbi:hypothetical protein VTK56DRAFT_3062 [Thermocarpiscus australiensis]